MTINAASWYSLLVKSHDKKLSHNDIHLYDYNKFMTFEIIYNVFLMNTTFVLIRHLFMKHWKFSCFRQWFAMEKSIKQNKRSLWLGSWSAMWSSSHHGIGEMIPKNLCPSSNLKNNVKCKQKDSSSSPPYQTNPTKQC